MACAGGLGHNSLPAKAREGLFSAEVQRLERQSHELGAGTLPLRAEHLPECLPILNSTKIPHIQVPSVCQWLRESAVRSPWRSGHAFAGPAKSPGARGLCCQLPSPLSAPGEAAQRADGLWGPPGRRVWGLGVLMASLLDVLWLVFQAIGCCTVHPDIMAQEVAVGHMPVETRTRGVQARVCLRLTGLLFFMCSDSR